MRKSKGVMFAVRQIMIAFMAILLFPALILAANVGIPAHAAKVQKIAPKNVRGTKGHYELKSAVKIISIEFRTEPSGNWLCTYEVKNTGVTTLNLRNAQFKTFQILTSGTIPIHTVNTGQNLAPGANVRSCIDWDRCSNASKVRLEVFYDGKKLDSKTVNVPPLKVKIIKAFTDKQNTKWSAIVRNSTGQAVKVAVRPISSAGKAGSEVSKVVPVNGKVQFSGKPGMKNMAGLQAIFKDEKKCSGPGYVVLDSKNFVFGPQAAPKPGKMVRPVPAAVIQSLTWTRGNKQWAATIKNNKDVAITVGISGWPLENAVPGMTVWSTETIAAQGTTVLVGDYHNFSVPPGTRLKVHVLLKPSNKKIAEKIIVLN